MHTNDFSEQDRATLLQQFRQFRLSENKRNDYSNRDELERKLENGGDLNETDIHMLQVAIADTVEDTGVCNYLIGLFDE